MHLPIDTLSKLCNPMTRINKPSLSPAVMITNEHRKAFTPKYKCQY